MSTSTHQKSRRYVYLVIIVVLAIILAIYTCYDNKNPNDPIKAPAAFAFIDANVVNNSYVPNVKVTLIDPNGQVRTTSGTSFNELTLKNGVMNLGLHYQAAVNEKEPYRYRIKAEAPGYITSMETVLLTDEEPGYFPVFMAKLESPPPGIGTVNTVLPVNSNGYVTSDTTFVTTVDSLAKSRFTVSITKGTRLLSNCKGVSVPSGEAAKIQLASFDPTAPNIGRIFPNGFLVTDAIDQNGEVIATPSDPLLFASAGWISANIQVGDQKVDGFSKPVEGTMTIDPKLINAETQKEFQVGDTIPIWSLDEATGNWNQEVEAMVQENSGELFVKFAMTHLSTWNLDYSVDKCASNISINIDNKNMIAKTYYADIVTAQTGSTIPMMVGVDGLSKINVTEFASGLNTYTISDAPENIPIALVIYDDPIMMDPTKVIGLSDVIEDCNNPINTIILPDGPLNMCVNLEVMIDEAAVNNNAIWYRACPAADDNIEDCLTWMESNAVPWRYGGVLIDGKLTTTGIDPNEDRYMFQIWFDVGDSIKFLLKKTPFSLDEGCTLFDSSSQTDTMFAEVESKAGVAATVYIQKTCSEDSSDSSTVLGCPDPAGLTCDSCPGSNEVTVRIEIDI